MRFELLTYDQKRRFLQRLHNRLNNMCFNGELNQLKRIDIDYVGGSDVGAAYGLRWVYNFETLEDEMQMCILFSPEFIDFIAELKKQSYQIYGLALYMHHEMIHQYCDENGIEDRESPDNDHNQAWAKAAEEHGLSVQYDEDGKLEGQSSSAAELLSRTIRIR